MSVFQFSSAPDAVQKPAVEPAAPVTRPVSEKSVPAVPVGPERQEAADMKDDALSSSGSGSDKSEPVASSSSDITNVAQIKRPSGRACGRKGKSSAYDKSIVRVPASLAEFAQAQLGNVASRSDAVSACLYHIFSCAVDASEMPDVPADIAELSNQFALAANSDLDIHRELTETQKEIANLTQLLKQTHKALLETQSAVIWLLGERMGSPGADVQMGAQRLNLAFSDAELLRHRISVQTRERELDINTKRGREIEDDKFRKSQRERGMK